MSEYSSGLRVLDQEHVQQALKFDTFQQGTIPHATTNKVFNKNITYVFDPTEHILLITSTIDPVSDYPETLKFIRKNLQGFDNYHLIIPLVGEGITERHIVTVYKAPGKDPILFDPKGSNPEHFLTPLPITWKKLKKFLNVIRGLGHSLWSFISKDSRDTQISDYAPEGLRNIRYEGLGMQSFFDGVTCGLHSVTMCRSIVKLLTTGQVINRESLVAELNTRKVIKEARKGRDKNNPLFDTDFASFLIDAVQETFYPAETQTRGFWAAVVFIIKLPLKIVAELPLKLLSKSCNYVINQLQQFAPSSRLGQFLRSAGLLFFRGLQGIFEIAHFVVRSISDPITNYKEAKAIHPALGYLSAALSVVGYTAIALFALPAIAPGLGIAGAIATVAKGVTWLLSTIGLNLVVSNTVLALAPVAMGVGIVTAGIKKVHDFVYGEKEEQQEEEEFTEVSRNDSSRSSYSGSLSEVFQSKAEPELGNELEEEVHQKQNRSPAATSVLLLGDENDDENQNNDPEVDQENDNPIPLSRSQSLP